MPQSATIYRVLVASPSDCLAERETIPQVIHNWNATHSRNTGAILEPVLWETHSTPEMGSRPQGILNRQLCSISDLLIATFWTRLGTNTGAAESGTAEEIEEFRAANKPVLLYFSQVPAVLDTVDQEQLQTLLAYKSKLAAEGLFSTYTSLPELRNHLYRHLSTTIAQIHGGPAPSTYQTSRHSFSVDATTLLIEAGKSKSGQINRFDLDQALVIQVNGQSFAAEHGNGRRRAALEGAIEELEGLGLIEDVSLGKRTVFQLTNFGYRAADTLSTTFTSFASSA